MRFALLSSFSSPQFLLVIAFLSITVLGSPLVTTNRALMRRENHGTTYNVFLARVDIALMKYLPISVKLAMDSTDTAQVEIYIILRNHQNYQEVHGYRFDPPNTIHYIPGPSHNLFMLYAELTGEYVPARQSPLELLYSFPLLESYAKAQGKPKMKDSLSWAAVMMDFMGLSESRVCKM
ncbi:hypothetical protein J3R30DRAFT_3694740 [Lentinula aciculospora]|uniref:Uncharacterized protein n=1 Tax=Lentinula aciculospora TaxID=153920 RepID=A0A9W9DTN8_9AGAR|nr:hypothetical protein J3R30DRAFT_3402549 [Lentinula aciculospora]KAJ4490877.1 hypothetical protein J3R30DRAFT_3694740 [Lentinula aciculospora]